MLAVVGPGAVGGLLAALLHRAGEDVVAVARPATAQRLLADGLHVRSELYGEWTAHLPVATEAPDGAAVVLAVKAYALPHVLPDLVTARPAEVLALLNGTAHAETLRRAGLPVAGASIQVESMREGGAVVHRGGFCNLTVPDDAASWRTTRALEGAGVAVRAGGTETEVLWRKYAFLAPMALLTSWTDAPIGPALEREPALAAGLVAEVAAVATAEGVPTEPAGLDRALRRLPETMRSSLQHDVHAGGPAEIEALGGDLLRLAERHGIDVPVLARLVGDVRGRLR
ncbi:ketopantoate reductase family protein [Georgenia yuyongxinii]|uniref:2-dehydropantoate 2-reductase n=1 Tax=Georgenia yuyongxinii TaxID=2589797 RepID=A0A552WJA5_9MICO|nr:2-dehydropantoate 2-reductase [Georgenia yuyongxinii]TRW42840.1 2-dehydropantoate 2-reductase [Georgenia yuyongxinii]